MRCPSPIGNASRSQVPEQQKSIPEVLADLWELLVSYAKQETVEPVKGLGRYIGYGIAASITGSIGILLLTLSGLRYLQDHNDGHLEGHWNWVPYAAALALLGLLVAIAVRQIRRGGAKR